MLQSSARDRVGPLCTMIELELQTEFPVSCEAGISWEFAVAVRGDDMPDWNLLAEGSGQCCHAGEIVDLVPHELCDIELLFRVPRCFVCFR